MRDDHTGPEGTGSQAAPPDGRAPAGTGLIPPAPLGVGAILRGALRMLRATGVDAAETVVVVLGPLTALAAAFAPAAPVADPVGPGSSLGVMAIAGLIGLLATPLVAGAVMWLVLERHRGATVGWRAAYRGVWPRYPSLLGATVLVVMIGMVVLLAVLLPVQLLAVIAGGPGALVAVAAVLGAAAAVAILGYLALPPVVVENATTGAAVARVGALLRTRPARLIGAALSAGVLLLLAVLAVSVVTDALASVSGGAAWLVGTAGTVAAQAVVIPLAVYVALLIYVDARGQEEGGGIGAPSSSV